MSFVMLSSSEVAPPALSAPTNQASPKSSKSASSRPENGHIDGGVGENKAMSHEMDRVNRLFEILSARSDIDHPVCTECTALLLSSLEARLEASVRERDAYIGFLKRLQNDVPTESELAASKEALRQAREDEEKATQELLRLEAERKAVDQELADLSAESLALNAEETAFWRTHNAFSSTLSSALAAHASITASLAHDTAQLSLLQRTNVHNDTFSISHDGIFGTINGLRLGRMAAHPVDWPEINAAWGHTLLLLSTMAKMAGFRFRGYELCPMGSTSSIVAVTEGRAGKAGRRRLELWTSGDMPLGLTFMHRRFDAAMAAFLDCLAQLGAFVEAASERTSMDRERRSVDGGSGRVSRDGSQRGRRMGLKMPYTIEGDKIGGQSIRLGMAQDDGWSSACKYVLTCCKYLLAHVSNGVGRGE